MRMGFGANLERLDIPGLRAPGRRVDGQVVSGGGVASEVPLDGIEEAVGVDGGSTVLAQVLTPRLDDERLDELARIGEIAEQAPSIRARSSAMSFDQSHRVGE